MAVIMCMWSFVKIWVGSGFSSPKYFEKLKGSRSQTPISETTTANLHSQKMKGICVGDSLETVTEKIGIPTMKQERKQ